MVLSFLYLLVACSLWSTVRSFIVDFTDAVGCGTVGVAWTKDSASETQPFTFPFYLNILPFNLTPAITPIPDWSPGVDAGYKTVPFLFPANISFVLGVTDSKGRGVGKTSPVRTAVDQSKPPCNAQTAPNQHPGGFQVLTTQGSDKCPSLNVSWTNSSNPSALFFAPGHSAFTLTDDAKGTSGSVKTPHGKYTSFSQVIVLFKDQHGLFASEQVPVGGQDNSRCASKASDSAFNFGTSEYNPRVAEFIIAFVLAGVTALFIVVFLLFWHCRRRGKLRDIESTPSSGPWADEDEVEKVSPETSTSPSVSMRTTRDPNESLQMSAVETPSENSYQSPRGRRPNLQVIVPSLVVPPVPPVPESLKTGSGFTSDPPETGKTDTSNRGRKLRKQITPNSDRKRRSTKAGPPSSFPSTPRRSSKTAARKSSNFSDITITTTTEDNFTLPDTEPLPDSPTVPAMYLDPGRAGRRARRSKSLLSNHSSTRRRSHRDYKMLQDDPEGSMPDSARRLSRMSILSRARTRSRSLPRS